jgi:hypothetical protein
LPVLDHMFARDRGDPSHGMQVDIEGCAGWSGAEPHA